MIKKHIVLFDMDGTLTPARQKIDWDIVEALIKLQRLNWDVGIISGSDLHYIYQQCDKLLDISPFDSKVCHFFKLIQLRY